MILFGGVFDPLHNGHLRVADAALEQLQAPSVVFLPAGQPPHKPNATLTNGAHRAAMLRAAVATRPEFQVDDRELHREGPSYTVLTLEELHQETPGRRIYLLLGADNVRSLGGWYQAERLLELCIPVAVPRPGHRADFTVADLPFCSADAVDELNRHGLRIAETDLASSDIRNRVAAGESIQHLVPSEVAEYIAHHALYR